MYFQGRAQNLAAALAFPSDPTKSLRVCFLPESKFGKMSPFSRTSRTEFSSLQYPQLSHVLETVVSGFLTAGYGCPPWEQGSVGGSGSLTAETGSSLRAGRESY